MTSSHIQTAAGWANMLSDDSSALSNFSPDSESTLSNKANTTM